MTEELPIDTSDPRTVQKAVKASKQLDLRKREALRAIMSTPEGRMWIHSLLLKAPIGSNPFSSDPYRTAFACGELNVTQQVVAELHDCSVELYLQMMKENPHGN